jgi:hypothetical protein
MNSLSETAAQWRQLDHHTIERWLASASDREHRNVEVGHTHEG